MPRGKRRTATGDTSDMGPSADGRPTAKRERTSQVRLVMILNGCYTTPVMSILRRII